MVNRKHKRRWAVRMTYDPFAAMFVCQVFRKGLLVASASDADYYLALAEGYGRAQGVIRTMRGRAWS